MTESRIRFFDEQRADSIDVAQERSLKIFREQHPEANIDLLRVERADAEEPHDYGVRINGVQ